MRARQAVLFGVTLAISALTLGTRASSRAAPRAPEDPLAAEIERWSHFLLDHRGGGEEWTQVKAATEPAIAEARAALASDRRLFAIERLAAARVSLSAFSYVAGRAEAERKDDGAFEAEWKRMGALLRADLGAPSPSALDAVFPAALRALGEAALPQIKIYYDTSLEYARNTMPEAGLFYVGAARAQREFVEFCRRLSEPAPGASAQPLRALGAELDALEARLLAAYRPPASIDRHPAFIAANSALKEARELDAAGLRYGALLRYLQGLQRVAALEPSAPADRAAVAQRLAEFDRRIAGASTDHSIGRLFLEYARAELDRKGSREKLERAPAIAAEVLPAYFAALAPEPPAATRPPARVTVTLVRWPYT